MEKQVLKNFELKILSLKVQKQLLFLSLKNQI